MKPQTLSPIMPVRPVAPWLGGKRNLAKRICAIIDTTPCTAYAEPFVGMGGIFLRRSARPRAEIINDKGKDIVEATVTACRLRLRPILMTSLAFGFGVIPLAIGTGAGAGGRVAIGTAVLGGMLASTLLGIFMVPVFFLLIRSWFRSRKRTDEASPKASATAEALGQEGAQ